MSGLERLVKASNNIFFSLLKVEKKKEWNYYKKF